MTSSAASRESHFREGSHVDHLFQLILETCPDLIYIYDRLKEHYLFVSERSTTMLGYTPQQIMQLTSEDIQQWIHPDDLAHAQAHYARQDQLADAQTSMATYRVRHAAGDYRLVRCRQKVFSRTPNGRAKLILGVGTDITNEARRKSELEELRTQIVRIRDEERRHLALRLHDTAMQHIVGASLLLRGMEARSASPDGATILGEARASLSQALREMLEPLARDGAGGG